MININRNTDSLRSLSQIFTPSCFKKIIRNGDIHSFEYRIHKHINNYQSNDYHSIIKFLYQKLEKAYRNEYIYKNAL